MSRESADEDGAHGLEERACLEQILLHCALDIFCRILGTCAVLKSIYL
jgi:hypothetical protein